MPRKRKAIAGLIALTMLGSTPVLAQSNSQNHGWDREAFWHDAPSDLRQRVEFVQQRIDRGVQDGSLTRNEARDFNRRLNSVRNEARRSYLTPTRRNNLQVRLDTLGREVRWQRHDDGGRYASRANFSQDGRFATNYDAARYYRDDPRYLERPVTYQDEVYRGSDGRYYCKRSDGTTGLIVGAIGGGVLGNVIDGGHNRVAGTLIGGALGAMLGGAIAQNSSNNELRCR